MAAPKPIRSIDMRLIDDLFQMGGGYVLDFSNRTFDEFFREELGVNIYVPRYAVEGDSKAKRLRHFLKTSDSKTRIRTLKALWEYREAIRRRSRTEEWVPEAPSEFRILITRLGGKKPLVKKKKAKPVPSSATLDPTKISALKSELMAASQLDPQARGYEWERFLRRLFDVNGLAPRASFRLVGETD